MDSPGFPALCVADVENFVATVFVLQTSGPKQIEKNQDHGADAAEGVIAPFFAVRPDGKSGDESDDHKYREN
jgi:hypothetical protein